MPSDKILNRINLYNDLRKNKNICTDFSVALDFKLSDNLIYRLQAATREYIMKTVQEWNSSKDININDYDYLINYRNEIINLPNRTPNGALHPKKETVVEYNRLQMTLNDILADCDIDKDLSGAANFNLRIQDGKDHRYKNRKYATTKLHSDAWVNLPGDAILTIIIDGDVSTGLEFNLPAGIISENIFDPVDEFNNGQQRYERLEHLTNAELGHLYIFDHACIHRTLKNDGGLRASLDFGVILKNSPGIRGDFNEQDNLYDRYAHWPIGEYMKFGSEIKYQAKETLMETYKKFVNTDYNKDYDNSAIKTNIILTTSEEQ